MPAAALQPLRPTLRRGLALMHAWFARMVEPGTHRFYYRYVPSQDRHVREGSPIRDLGTAADVAALQSFLGRGACGGGGGRTLDLAVNATLAHYEGMLVRERTLEEGGVATAEGLGATETEAERGEAPLPRAWLSSMCLGEPSSVAHNAMMLLALCAHELYPDEERKEALMAELAAGIMHQQRKDGSFKVYFDPGVQDDSGWELYWGEAALALATAYTRLGDERLLRSARRALMACRREYEAGRVRDASLVFFANWQCQAARALLRHTTDAGAAGGAARYVFALQDGITRGGAVFGQMCEAPEGVSTVEVACALEGLADAYAVALQRPQETEEGWRLEAYDRAIHAAVEFLCRVQAGAGAKGEGASAAGVGGFGHGLRAEVQRIDVTGHACTAYIKLLELAGEVEEEKNEEDEEVG